MPLQYSSILDEAKAVRNSAGVFDVSHMGRIFVRGKNAEGFLNYLTTNDVGRLKEGEVQYSLIPNDRGGVIDDITVYRLSENEFMLCVNAANREKVLRHFEKFVPDYGVEVEDRSEELVQLALQGREAEGVIGELFPEAPKLKYYTFLEASGVIVSRTGYTGEDGFEIYIPAEGGIELFKEFLKRGVKPCGLGARDVLRIEAGFPLYGHELSEELNPLEANLKRFVKTDKEFFGKEKLLGREPKRKLRGLILSKRTVARRGDKVFLEGKPVGEVSSGTFSPTLGRSIALAFLDREVKIGQTVEVEIRGKLIPAEVVKPRFVDNVKR
jgi:aminomethyltransferase